MNRHTRNCIVFTTALILSLVILAVHGQASSWTLAGHAFFRPEINDVVLFYWEGWLWNYTAGPGAVLAYELYPYNIGVVHVVNETGQPVYWLVLGPYLRVETYGNDTFVYFRWRVYESPAYAIEPLMVGDNATWIWGHVERASDNESRTVENITLVHSYDIIVWSAAIEWGPIYNVYNITRLYENPWLANITMAHNTTLVYTFTSPGIVLALNASLFYLFGAWTSIEELSYLLSYTLAKPGYSVEHYNLTYSFPESFDVRLYCRRLKNGTADVYLVVRGWGYLRSLNVTDTWFNVTSWPLILAFDGTPEPRLYVNATTLVYEWLLQIPSSVYILNATARYMSIYNVTGIRSLQCALVTKVLLEVPSYIVTYEPSVEYSICAYDYYTLIPLPGLAIGILVDGERVSTVYTGPDGCVNVTIVLEKPGTYTVEYMVFDRVVAKTTISYMAPPGYNIIPSINTSVQFVVRKIPAQPVWAPPSLVTLDTPTMLVVGAALAALWAWMATSVSISYATVAIGIVASVLGVVSGNMGLVAAGAVAMTMGALLRRLGY